MVAANPQDVRYLGDWPHKKNDSIGHLPKDGPTLC